MKIKIKKRTGLFIIQHLIAMLAFVALAVLMLNAYVEVESIEGKKVYRIFPINTELAFEDSEIFHDLYSNAVSDITQLVVIKEQMETNDVFDPTKLVDITAYADKIGVNNDCRTTAIYKLGDIIKWGKNGMESMVYTMTIQEFVNYFGNCIYPENFKLTKDGKLVFDDFYRVDERLLKDSGKSGDTLTQIKEALDELAMEQKEGLVFSYLYGQDLKEVSLVEINGETHVQVSMMQNRYFPVSENDANDSKDLVRLCTDWVDYFCLQNNLIATIEDTTRNYRNYEKINVAYSEKNSNVKYMVRMTTDSGVKTHTNVSSLKKATDDEVTEYFSEYRRYLIYYPDNLVFTSNTALSEEQLDEYINLYEYAYQDTTHIWLGVDTSYTNEGDVFYDAHQKYGGIVPNVNRILTLILILVLVWIGLLIYQTMSVDREISIEKKKILWTEVIVCIGISAFILGLGLYRRFYDYVSDKDMLTSQFLGIRLTRTYQYVMFSLLGVYLSVSVNSLWYAIYYRIQSGVLWKKSFLHFLCRKLQSAYRTIVNHKNTAINTILPYNAFVVCNMLGIVVAYNLRMNHLFYSILILFLLVVIDCVVGVALFRTRTEQKEIVSGINRIRAGEVEFKLDAEVLHGSNKEMADAVNNIGEGIRKAVQTSMKDEQMKTDLITNVSHDIKTPLTSIINYVDLLKRSKIEDELAKGYIAILDSKAQRLKQLSDDLVEASKISSGNIILEKSELNLAELLNQSIGEFSEKFEEQKLQIVFHESDQPAYIYADSRRMWRVVENLFNNVCKYALEGTRVYIDMEKRDGKIIASIKNISKMQMNVKSSELTERFIRGDVSRTTEGSGLGLSIAKSLVQVQGGYFEIILDGDLFKAVITFPEYEEEMKVIDLDVEES